MGYRSVSPTFKVHQDFSGIHDGYADLEEHGEDADPDSETIPGTPNMQPPVQTKSAETPVALDGTAGNGLNKKDQHGSKGTSPMSSTPQHIQANMNAS